MGKARNPDNDAFYMLNLCDGVLASKASREHRFEWLRGDISARTGRSVPLPVDGFWKDFGLVIEVMESQHFESTPHFDKPDVITASGVHRGLQRRLYDQRKAVLVTQRGLSFIAIATTEFETRGKKIKRDQSSDLEIVRHLLFNERLR